jgi:hypothetical protein
MMALALSLGGCVTCATPPEDNRISLDGAELEIAAGKVGRGLEIFADFMKQLERKTDWGAAQTRARILTRCFEIPGAVDSIRRASLAPLLSVVDTEAHLLSAAAEQWKFVICGSSTADAQMEAALRIAKILRLKIDKPELRRAALPGNVLFGGMEYRRLMIESWVEFERYALGRSPVAGRDGARLAETLKMLGVEAEAIAMNPKVTPSVAATWRALAESCAIEAAAVVRAPQEVTVKPETYSFVEADAKRQIEDAGNAAEGANREIGSSGAPERVVPAIEAALRRYLFVLETTGANHEQGRAASKAVAFWYPRLDEWAHR